MRYQPLPGPPDCWSTNASRPFAASQLRVHVRHVVAAELRVGIAQVTEQLVAQGVDHQQALPALERAPQPLVVHLLVRRAIEARPAP